MATKIIRYTNRYTFQILGNVDFSTDEIVIADYAIADPTMIYCARNCELVSKPISDNNYTEFLMSTCGITYYRISSDEKAKLLSEGVCTATNNSGSTAKVFVGLKVKALLEEQGTKSLAQCYEMITKQRKQHADKQAEINKLLSIGASVDNEEESSKDTLVDEIKWFLDNRKEIKAKYKK